MRVCFIGLERNQSRWNKALAHLELLESPECFVAIRPKEPLFLNDEAFPVEPGQVQFCMACGVDAHEFLTVYEDTLDVEYVERHLDCKVYRGWAVTDEFDVARISPETAIQAAPHDIEFVNGTALLETDEKAQMAASKYGLHVYLAYENWFRGVWHKRFVDKYVGYFMRHMTLGECGSSLAHLRVLERQVADRIPIQFVFEDDARPVVDFLDPVLAKIEALDAIGERWDLILLHSVKYDLIPEQESRVDGLFIAGHRKVTDAYCMSLRGAQKICRSGYRYCLFPFDDFLPALYSHHPRKDLALLPCIANIKEFKAYTFPDDANMSIISEESLVSGNNVSPCLFGDHGVT